MSVPLSRMSKRELQDLAEEMKIDVSNFSLKKDYYLGIKEYIAIHKNEFTPGHKYFDYAHAGRGASSPSKRQFDYSIAVNTSDDESSEDEEPEAEKDSDDAVLEVKDEDKNNDSDNENVGSVADAGEEEVQLKEEENDDDEDGDEEEEEEENEQDDEEEEEDEENGQDDEEAEDDDEEEDEEEDEVTVFLEENRTTGPAIAAVVAKFGTILKRSQPKSENLDKAENYILERNYRVREFLSDPYHINDWLIFARAHSRMLVISKSF
ncbi:unnamed protein product [Ambrosiozyma monospora]|uniref:Unnamed protein product n=1 Tax=Ambrosiozyma monospora TaxID=43982 RepID=A0A9W6YWK8_AMBMO|nr:unnamed protein product [Ambrosiozyma monospora]